MPSGVCGKADVLQPNDVTNYSLLRPLAGSMDDESYESIPAHITASGLRRIEQRIPEEEVLASAHGHVKTSGQIGDDFPDEKAIRIRTGEEKRFHERVEGEHGERKGHGLVTPAKAEVSKDRRPGYGVERTYGAPEPI